MNDIVCNYAIARFRPYHETAEFVNVGIVLICPQVGYFGHIFEHRKHKRITDFFPELDVEVFRAGLRGLRQEIARVSGREEEMETRQLVMREAADANMAGFRELVRPREALFQFGGIGTVMATDPHAKLQELFQHYIKRQFARDREYQEIIMRRNLADFLRKNHLERDYKIDQRVGDEAYHVVLPFVHFDNGIASKAIKPLHLDKEGTTEIYRHGDAWISTVKRLRQINHLPKNLLFTVKGPKGQNKRAAAVEEICKELQAQHTQTVPFAETNRILNFARI